jgi:hypothetical protein
MYFISTSPIPPKLLRTVLYPGRFTVGGKDNSGGGLLLQGSLLYGDQRSKFHIIFMGLPSSQQYSYYFLLAFLVSRHDIAIDQ